ncbi:hypothetical protein DPMN_045173, partial [Dreissena polymorpha]
MRRTDTDTLKCWNRIVKAFANSLDPDETPQNVASHQDPNCRQQCGAQRGAQKIADKWEDVPYVVIDQPNTEIPVYDVKKDQPHSK